MKILIIGAKGNLGSQLVKVFSDFEVIAWDKESLDVTDKDQVREKISNLKTDVIINTASFNAVDKCEEPTGFEMAQKINGEAVGFLADAALAVNAILVHYSTDYVFSGDEQGGYIETDMPAPISKYGESKLMGEREIFKKAALGLKYYLIRTSKLFGPKGESEVAKPSFFDIMLKLAKEKEYLEVVDEEMSCFTYTPDLARATRKLIDDKKESGIYHIINEGACTWYEAVLELFKIAGVDVRVNPVTSEKFPRLAQRPKYSVLLNTKVEKLRHYKEALKEYISRI